MSQPDFDKLLQKYLSGKCSPKEEAMVLQWYQHLINESKLEISEAEKESIQTKIWANLEDNISVEQAPVKQLQTYRSLVYRAAIAASVIVLAGTAWFWWPKQPASALPADSASINKEDVLFTNKSETEQEITLNDGSVVRLQPKATLSYPRVLSGHRREVQLTGNAFFKVYPDPARKFVVHSGKLVTEVLGTSFHIHQNEAAKKMEVSVVTGKVSVYQQDKRINNLRDSQPSSVILTPNQKVTYNTANSQFITSLVEEPELLAPQGKVGTGNFIFDNVPLAQVLEELRKAYGIEIYTENKDVENCHFSGDITRQDLYKKLEIICLSSPSASYEVRGTTIFIKGRGCSN